MVCPDCGVETYETAESCAECGRSLAVPVGTVLADRYEIQVLLGAGGLGRVYRAHDRMLDEVVAVKVLHPEAARSPELSKRFRSEIKLARKVRHRNVCAIHEYGEHGAYRFVAMELVDGIDLHRVMRERGPLPPRDAFDVAIQVTKGLSAIHDAGVIHRDLKTPNIMQDSKGVVRLLDFGIAKLLSPTGTLAVTAVQRVVGTPEYMSPEQIRGDDLDERSDIYGLGVVIFEIFTGNVPFQGKSPLDTLLRQVNEPPPLYGEAAARLPTSLIPVLRKTLAKDPKDRYASAHALTEALRVARRAAYPEASFTPPDRDPLESEATTPQPPPGLRTTVLPKPPLPARPPAPAPPLVSRPRARVTPEAPPMVAAPPVVSAVAAPPLTPPPITVPPVIVRPTPPPLPSARDTAVEAGLDDNRTFLELPKVPPPLPSPVPPPVVGDSPVASAITRGWAIGAVLAIALGVVIVALARRPPSPSAGPAVQTTPSAPIPPTPAGAAPTPAAVPTPAAASPSTAVAVAPSGAPAPVHTPAPTPPVVALAASPSPSPRPRVRPTPVPTPSPTPVATPTPPTTGALDVDVRPSADVEVEGRPAGHAPLLGLQLDPGSHLVKLVHPDYWPLRRRIGVEAGKTARLEVDLSWEGVPRARSRETPFSLPMDGSPSDPYFDRGLRQMSEGEYQEAVLTLEPVVRRLQGGKIKEQARAEFYLGVAYLELNRQALAKERFGAALEHDPSLKPSSAAFSSKVMSFFGAVRESARKKP